MEVDLLAYIYHDLGTFCSVFSRHPACQTLSYALQAQDVLNAEGQFAVPMVERWVSNVKGGG